MSETLTITYDAIPQRLYWKAAASACKVKSERRVSQTLLFVLGWFGIMGLVVIANRFDFVLQGGPAFLLGMVIMWVGLMLFGRIQRRKLNSVLDDEQARRGPVTMQFGPEGCHFTSSFGVVDLKWRAVDQIIDLGEGTGLRTGLMVYPVPDGALPPGLSPDDFRSQLNAFAERDRAPQK